MLRRALLLLAVAAAALSYGEPILTPTDRAARDAQRLDATRAVQQRADTTASDVAQRRVRRTSALATARSDLATVSADNAGLERLELTLGDDLTQVDALVRSALQAQVRRLTVGPIGVDQPQMRIETTRLLQAPATLPMFYDAWFALHTEWVASADVVRSEQPLTRRDGDRRVVPITRLGGVGLVHARHDVIVDPVAGLLEAPPTREPTRMNKEFLAQQIYDSGAIGVALLLCAAAGVLLILRRLGALAFGKGHIGERRGWLKLLASASLLLGLLGTVVGLIHTFRALAQFGGSQVSVAAAGISHALATTWMGLSIAIPLLLAQGLLTALPQSPPSLARAPRAPGARRRPARRWPTWPRFLLALVGGTGLGFALFFLMQWLTQRPLAEPVAANAPVTVVRIDWSTEPPPPPPEAVRTTDAPVPAAAQGLTLPAVEPLPTPSAQVDLPTLNLSGVLAGLANGGGPAIGAGTLWSGASSGEQIMDGRALVPISSARPDYPTAAFAAGVEGWVEAIFIIDASGQVRDVRIIDAEPPGVFEQAAAAALQRWLYAPLYRDGQPVAREATQLLRFSLDDVQP